MTSFVVAGSRLAFFVSSRVIFGSRIRQIVKDSWEKPDGGDCDPVSLKRHPF
jgi:hypothetical protein